MEILKQYGKGKTGVVLEVFAVEWVTRMVVEMMAEKGELVGDPIVTECTAGMSGAAYCQNEFERLVCCCRLCGAEWLSKAE